MEDSSIFARNRSARRQPALSNASQSKILTDIEADSSPNPSTAQPQLKNPPATDQAEATGPHGRKIFIPKLHSIPYGGNPEPIPGQTTPSPSAVPFLVHFIVEGCPFAAAPEPDYSKTIIINLNLNEEFPRSNKRRDYDFPMGPYYHNFAHNMKLIIAWHKSGYGIIDYGFISGLNLDIYARWCPNLGIPDTLLDTQQVLQDALHMIAARGLQDHLFCRLYSRLATDHVDQDGSDDEVGSEEQEIDEDIDEQIDEDPSPNKQPTGTYPGSNNHSLIARPQAETSATKRAPPKIQPDATRKRNYASKTL